MESAKPYSTKMTYAEISPSAIYVYNMYITVFFLTNRTCEMLRAKLQAKGRSVA